MENFRGLLIETQLAPINKKKKKISILTTDRVNQVRKLRDQFLVNNNFETPERDGEGASIISSLVLHLLCNCLINVFII